MTEVHLTIAKSPSHEYPFAVVIVADDGSVGQETLVRSYRDGIIAGNGTLHGLHFAGVDCSVNVTVDPRITMS